MKPRTGNDVVDALLYAAHRVRNAADATLRDRGLSLQSYKLMRALEHSDHSMREVSEILHISPRLALSAERVQRIDIRCGDPPIRDQCRVRWVSWPHSKPSTTRLAIRRCILYPYCKPRWRADGRMWRTERVGRPAQPLAARLRAPDGGLRTASCQSGIGDATVEHHQFTGPAYAQHPSVLRRI